LAEVTVIGGGIIGVSCALALQREGVATTLIERGSIGGQATFGNCALLAVSEIVPLAKPGVMGKLPGWLLNPEGPLAIRPGHLPTALPWLARFLLNARAHRVAQICHHLGAITAHAQNDFDDVIEAADIQNIWGKNEVLYLYDSRQQYDKRRSAITWAPLLPTHKMILTMLLKRLIYRTSGAKTKYSTFMTAASNTIPTGSAGSYAPMKVTR